MARTTDELIAELSEFLRIPSISSGDGTAEDLAAAAQWVCNRIVSAGGTAEVLPTQVNPLVVGHLPSSTGDGPQVLLYGHYDVQTVAPLADWTTPPFEPTIRDGAIYARGASDDTTLSAKLRTSACRSTTSTRSQIMRIQQRIRKPCRAF
jgi:acetylornithine deacetylase/succinyl-diaminopimelate desuccinylase-like protein